jgi:hypothetical protein
VHRKTGLMKPGVAPRAAGCLAESGSRLLAVHGLRRGLRLMAQGRRRSLTQMDALMRANWWVPGILAMVTV